MRYSSGVDRGRFQESGRRALAHEASLLFLKSSAKVVRHRIGILFVEGCGKSRALAGNVPSFPALLFSSVEEAKYVAQEPPGHLAR